MNRRKPLLPGRHARGVALLESLVAILIFAFGILGVVGLQTAMTRAQTSSKFRGDAAYLANELMASMWTDIPNLTKYQTAGGTCDGHPRCLAWKNKVQTVLPSGTVTVTAPSIDGEVSITIQWAVPGEGTHQYTTTVNVKGQA